MTAPDFFLRGYLKEKVYANKPQTLADLKNNIQAEINAILPENLKKVMRNVLKSAELCNRAGGAHLSDIVFHT